MGIVITLSKIERFFFGCIESSRLASRFELTKHDFIVTEAREIAVFSAWSCQYQEKQPNGTFTTYLFVADCLCLVSSLLYSCFSVFVTQLLVTYTVNYLE